MKLALRTKVALLAVLVCIWVWFARNQDASFESAAAAPRSEAVSVPSLSPALEALTPDHSTSKRAETRADVNTAEAGPSRRLATINVRVVSAETGTPCVARRVAAHPKSTNTDWSTRPAAGSVAEPGESARTDAGGRATLHIESDVAYEVQLTDGGRIEPSQAAPPLAAGAEFELVFTISAGAETVFCARLIDADTRAPIVGATAVVDDFPESSTVSAGDGSLELRVRPDHDDYARIEAPGYSWRELELDRAHTTRDVALEIAIPRAATLEVAVLDANGALTDARAVLSTNARNMRVGTGAFRLSGTFKSYTASWRALSTATVSARFEELPAQVPLELTVVADRTSRVEPSPIVLEPGESKRIEIRIASGARIVSRVETSTGVAVNDVEIWCAVGKAMDTTRLFRRDDKPAARTRSDANGAFVFEDVAVGRWLVGLAPPTDSIASAPAAPGSRFPALAIPIEVGLAATSVDVVLRVDFGLYLRGVVLTPLGEGQEASVFARSKTETLFLNANADGEGRFEVGPLLAGDYELSARAHNSDFAPSEPIVAAAGARDLELRLQVGASVSVRVVDQAGQLAAATLTLSLGPGANGYTRTSTRDGLRTFQGLAPGMWTLSASSDTGLCAVASGVQLVAHAPAAEVELRLLPAARILARYVGDEPAANYSFMVDGGSVGTERLERNKPRAINLPAGAIEVRRSVSPGEPAESHTLKLAPGETVELQVGG